MLLGGCVLLIIAALVYVTYTNKPEQTATFVVGTVAGYAPFVSINQQGEYEGFDVDMARAVAATMGKQLVLKDLGSMPSLFTALQQGSIDAIIWGVSITEERLQKVAMIHYQGEITSSYPLIFWESIPAGVQSIADMHGKVVCVEPASSQEAVLCQCDGIVQLSTERVDDALLNIRYGKADAAFVEPAIAKKFKAKFPELQILDVPLATKDCVQGVGIVISKDKSALIQDVTDAVSVLKKDGTVARLEQQWGIE